MRALTWSEKVTRMQQSLLSRYRKEGDRMLQYTGVYVCSICGFIFVGGRTARNLPGLQGAVVEI